MKSVAPSLLLLFFFSLPSHATPPFSPEGAIRDDGELILSPGEQRLIKVRGLTRFSIGGKAVRAQPVPRAQGILPDSDALLIKALLPGTGDLWVWTSSGAIHRRSIRVDKGLPPQLSDVSLARALGQLNEVEIFYSGAGATLRGVVRSFREAARIAALCERHPGVLEDLTEASDALLTLGEARVRQWLSQSSGKGPARLTVERSAGGLWVRGSIPRADTERSLRAKLRALFPLIRLQIQALPDDSPTVHFKVYLVELKKNRFRSIGLEWPGRQDAAFRASSSGIQNLVQLDVSLEALESEGSAKLLSKPELVVRVPGEAELFSGGELPIVNRGQFQSSTAWKTFGLSLQLKVSHSTSDRVRLDIHTEISHLDATIAGDSKIPGLQTNRMKTQVDAHYGVPLFLSGLLQEQMRRNARGIPLLRDIPVLGALFGSEDWLSERSELIAILLPSLAPPLAPMDRTEMFSRTPRGPVPPPRNRIDPAEKRALQQSATYPWNALNAESR